MADANSESLQTLAFMGYSIATERGEIRKGIELCHKARIADPNNIDNYLYLGKIFLFAGKREAAIKAFRAGLKIRRDIRAIEELQQLGIRKQPPIGSLPREHNLNIALGRISKYLGLR
jgi:tetratricopeptide (TPR) repeat protein